MDFAPEISMNEGVISIEEIVYPCATSPTTVGINSTYFISFKSTEIST